MKVAITGATGFIGSWLAQRHHSLGDEVVLMGRVANDIEKFRHKSLVDAGLHVSEIPVSDQRALDKALSGCESVYHLAAAQHEANVPDQHFWDVNVDGTINVLRAAAKAGAGRLVHGSTIGVYGSAADGEINERTPTHPDNIYGVTKLEGENQVRQFADKLPVSIVRISETFGPGDGRLLKLFKAIAKKRFFIIGGGENIHQLIYVDDLARGMMMCATDPGAIGETFVLAGSERLTTEGMCTEIADALNTALPSWKAPMWPFLVVAVMMEKTLTPIGIQPPLHRRRLDFFRKSFFFDQSKAKTTLKFSPNFSFADGVHATAEWYRNAGLM